ncbi:MAG: Uma2 family endonuclease [Planctomycetes bacterium]|nr:Uma2 family endonuclease [Planctomycetota bacterium]
MSATAFETPLSKERELRETGSSLGELTWEIARLYPRQGEWTEQEYLALDTNQLIEFSDGVLEFLPMPSWLHQAIVQFLYRRLHDFAEPRDLGRVLFAPLPVRLRPGKYREPDIGVFGQEHVPADPHGQPHGARLLVEVVSPGERNRKRDLETKRDECARAQIPEYWIVDPERRTIAVLVLDGSDYRLHGEFAAGQSATSVELDGFSVEVDAVFAVVHSQMK